MVEGFHVTDEKTTETGGKRGRTIVTNEQVYQCVVDFVTANPPRMVTKKAIADELGVAYPLIDEHVDKLKRKGRVRHLFNGVYEPTHLQPDRMVSSTAAPGGRVKLDIGDECLDLSIREVRSILYVLGGFGMQYDLRKLGRKVTLDG